MKRCIDDENISEKFLGDKALDTDARINPVIKADASFKNDKSTDLIG